MHFSATLRRTFLSTIFICNVLTLHADLSPYLSSGQDIDWNAKEALPESIAQIQKKLDTSKDYYLVDEGNEDQKADFYRNLINQKARANKSEHEWLQEMGSDGVAPDWYYSAYLDHSKKAFNSVNDLEAAVIVSYSEWLYQLTNGFLWNPLGYLAEYFEGESKLPSKDEASLRLLASGLNKMPSFNLSPVTGKKAKLYRNHGRALQTPLNKVWIAKPFLSTTRAELALASKVKYKHNAEFLLIIEPNEKSRSHDIQGFSTRPEEEEVLFLPNTPFLVVNSYIQNLKKLEEIDGSETQEEFKQTVYELKECAQQDCSDIN